MFFICQHGFDEVFCEDKLLLTHFHLNIVDIAVHCDCSIGR